MMKGTIKVNFRDLETLEFPEGTTLEEISHSFQKHFSFPILVAKVDNHLKSLKSTLERKCNIDFYDRSMTPGNTVYANSVQLLLIVAVKRLFGANVDVHIEHSIDRGIYCELEGEKLTKALLTKLENEMKEIVKEDLIYTKLSVLRLDAIKYFKKKNQMDKVNVLKYISNSFINLYRLDEEYDYFFGEMAPSTKYIDEFKLTYIKDNGFVLSYPNIYNPECTLDYKHHQVVFDEFLKYTNWGRNINISNASDLNRIVSVGKYQEVIQLAETHYESQLAKIADMIYEKKGEVKFILLSGPSSSGKTTTAKKLSIYLQARGFNTYSISTDDYFLERKDTPRDANGEYDFEILEAIDLNLFNKHMTKLLDGEKVLLPEYNFIAGKKEYKKNYLQLKEDDICIIEGLHAINDVLTMSIEKKNKFKIYVSPLTQLNIDNHNRIHTSDTRRLRRIIRDSRTRGYMAADTLKLWAKIREGEEKFIYPYQDECDIVINTALVYELGVLKTYAEPLLFSVPEDDPTYPEALRLINFLRNFLPIPSEEVPKDSVLREFIGGGYF